MFIVLVSNNNTVISLLVFYYREETSMNILLSICFFCVLCKKESHRFGMTWEWLNDRMFILGWTVPLRCVFVRGSLALWPEMSRVVDTAKAMCLNSVAFERGGYVHKHTHNSLMLKRKQGTGGLNAYHNPTHGQCVCVCVCLSDLRWCQCWSSSTALLSSSQPALKNKHVLETARHWLPGRLIGFDWFLSTSVWSDPERRPCSDIF